MLEIEEGENEQTEKSPNENKNEQSEVEISSTTKQIEESDPEGIGSENFGNITTNKKSITDEFQNILNRADAVRFANITVEESKKDIKDFKELLVNLDRVC